MVYRMRFVWAMTAGGAALLAGFALMGERAEPAAPSAQSPDPPPEHAHAEPDDLHAGWQRPKPPPMPERPLVPRARDASEWQHRDRAAGNAWRTRAQASLSEISAAWTDPEKAAVGAIGLELVDRVNRARSQVRAGAQNRAWLREEITAAKQSANDQLNAVLNDDPARVKVVWDALAQASAPF